MTFNQIHEKISTALSSLSADAEKENLASLQASLLDFFKSEALIEHTQLLGCVLNIIQASSESQDYV